MWLLLQVFTIIDRFNDMAFSVQCGGKVVCVSEVWRKGDLSRCVPIYDKTVCVRHYWWVPAYVKQGGSESSFPHIPSNTSNCCLDMCVNTPI